MIKKLLLATVFSAMTIPAMADDAARRNAKEVHELKDGSTLYIFVDGKMALRDSLGRPVQLREGPLETKDGRKITAQGNEVGRLSMLVGEGHTEN